MKNPFDSDSEQFAGPDSEAQQSRTPEQQVEDAAFPSSVGRTPAGDPQPMGDTTGTEQATGEAAKPTDDEDDEDDDL